MTQDRDCSHLLWNGTDAHVDTEWVQKGITKLKNILEGEEEEQFSAEQYMMLYT